MFCKETKIDGDFDTKIVLGSGHVLAFQVLRCRHTQAQESYSKSRKLWNKDLTPFWAGNSRPFAGDLAAGLACKI